jgi:hypothetical protein
MHIQGSALNPGIIGFLTVCDMTGVRGDTWVLADMAIYDTVSCLCLIQWSEEGVEEGFYLLNQWPYRPAPTGVYTEGHTLFFFLTFYKSPDNSR